MPFTSASKPRAAVVGGGLSGLVCAAALAEQGLAVTLLESRRTLGGRATSWRDPALGLRLDNGPHLVAGAYTELARHGRRVGTRGPVAASVARPVVLRSLVDGRAGRLGTGSGRWHMGHDLLRYDVLGWQDRLGLLRALAEAARGVHPDRPLDRWLADTRQSPAARRWLWDPMARAICNDDPRHISARLFATVVERLFLKSGDGFPLSYPVPTLAESCIAPTERFLAARGATVRCGTRAVRVERRGRGFEVVVEGGETVRADLLCLAVPARSVVALLGAASGRVSVGLPAAARVPATPLVSVAVWLREAASPWPDDFFGLVDAPFAWVFDRRRLVPNADAPEAVVLVAPGDATMATRSAQQIGEDAVAVLGRLGVPAGPRDRIGLRVVKELHAAPRLAPASAAARPAARTAWPGLALAGDWTDTGLPATLEGAAVSGHRAAAALLRMAGGAWYVEPTD